MPRVCPWARRALGSLGYTPQLGRVTLIAEVESTAKATGHLYGLATNRDLGRLNRSYG
jgi:hypothetical protein